MNCLINMIGKGYSKRELLAAYIMNFIKNVIVISLSALLFISGKLLLAETQQSVTWGMSALIYLIGFHWVFAYFTNSRMFAPYIVFKAEDESDRNKFSRIIFMLLGVVLCIVAITT